MYMLFLPPTTVYILLTKTVTLYRNCHDGNNASVQMNEDENETNVDSDVTTPNVQLLISCFEQSSTTSIRIENDKQEHEQQTDEDKAKEEILNIILGPSDVHFWPGVIHTRKVLLSVIFVWCDLFVLRIYGIILVLAIYLILLLHKKPYKDRVVLWLDESVTISLIIIGTLSLYDTQSIYYTAETKESRQLYNVFQIVKFAIIVMQPFIFGTLLLKEKYFPEDMDSDRDKKKN